MESKKLTQQQIQQYKDKLRLGQNKSEATQKQQINLEKMLQNYDMKEIARANNSIIYEIKNKIDRQEVKILKMIEHDCANSKEGQHRKQCQHLNNEFSKLSGIENENIVRFYSQIIDQVNQRGVRCCAVIMERCQKDIFQHISELYPVQIGYSYLKNVFTQITKALHHLHESQEFVHLDIKPENILIRDSDNVVLADFGFCQKIKRMTERSTVEKVWKNRSKLYQPPEVIQICDVIDRKNAATSQKAPEIHQIDYKKVDIYQLGVTMFSLYYLMHPYRDREGNIVKERFNFLQEKKTTQFWKSDYQITQLSKAICSEKSPSHLAQIQSLLIKMIDLNEPDKRPTTSEILLALKQLD